jgi:hypothetical protein
MHVAEAATSFEYSGRWTVRLRRGWFSVHRCRGISGTHVLEEVLPYTRADSLSVVPNFSVLPHQSNCGAKIVLPAIFYHYCGGCIVDESVSYIAGHIVPAYGLESSTHSCNSQRSHRALPNLSKSMTPNPPRSFDLLTIGQLTRQWPPFVLSSLSIEKTF